MAYPFVSTGMPVRTAAPAQGSQRGAGALRYLLGCVLTIAGCYAAVLGGLFLLRATDRLPPPVVTNNLCFDEKLQWMSSHLPSSEPDLLVFGSSVAWRQFVGQKAIESGLATTPYNLAFCGTRMSQTAFLVDYFLSKDRFDSPRRAIVMAAPEDFEGCASAQEHMFVPADADTALFSGPARFALYLKNVDFVSMVRNATVIKSMRDGANAFDRIEFTEYGDGPLDVDGSRGLTYGQISNIANQCFASLTQIARQFAARNIEFALVLTPIHPKWIAEFDPQRQRLRDLRLRVAQAIDGTPTRLLDETENQAFSEPEFTDAIHLRWAAAKRLTTIVARGIKAFPAE